MNQKTVFPFFLIVTLVLTFVPLIHANPDIFGYESKGSSSYGNADYIIGTPYTCSGDGTINSITAYVFCETSGNHIKYGIWETSDDSLVDYTVEHTTTGTEDGWIELSIVSGASVENGVEYYLGVWFDSFDIDVFYDSGVTGFYDSESYNGFPNPLNPTNWSNHKFSVYCTYTPSGKEQLYVFSEMMNVSDALTTQRACKTVFTETIITSSSFTDLKEKLVSLTQTITISESLTIGREKIFIITETVIFSSSMEISKELLFLFQQIFTESVEPSDTLTIWRELKFQSIESIDILDSFSISKESKIFFIEMFETLTPQTTLIWSEETPVTVSSVLGLVVIALIIAVCALALATLEGKKRG